MTDRQLSEIMEKRLDELAAERPRRRHNKYAARTQKTDICEAGVVKQGPGKPGVKKGTKRKPYKKKEKEPYDQRTAKLTEAEKAIRAENLAAREAGFDENGIRALWAAVSLRAMRDFNAARKQGDRKSAIMDECREFFDSDAFDALTDGLDARDVEQRMDEIDITELEKATSRRRDSINVHAELA